MSRLAAVVFTATVSVAMSEDQLRFTRGDTRAYQDA
jgi:hypothetical protein